METLLQQTLVVGLAVGAVKSRSLKRVSVDTTVQPKAITHPTDSKLLNRSREHLVGLAKKEGIRLRQSYQRKGPQAALKAGRKTNIITPELKDALTQAKRLLRQKRNDSHKLYSLYEPHVSCISKGKAQKKYEFGNKVSVCVTNKENFIIGTQGLEGNPYDGHTLKGALEQVTKLTGTRPERCYVDRGYRGHGVTGTAVFLSGQRRGVTPTIKKELKRRKPSLDTRKQKEDSVGINLEGC